MAHYAELDKNGIVLRVIVGIDENVGNGEAIYAETTGTVWKRTSYNTIGGIHLLGGKPFRLNYASIGYSYNVALDGFISPQPAPSWTLIAATGLWQSPVPYPQDSNRYYWNERLKSWMPLSGTISVPPS